MKNIIAPIRCSASTARLLGAELRYRNNGGAPNIVAQFLAAVEKDSIVISADDGSVWIWKLQPGALPSYWS